MATTSLWHVSGRLTDLIKYVENPEKTIAKDAKLGELFDVIDYVRRDDATAEGEYVSTINCMRETAFEQMIMTKKQFGKTSGYIAWHGYQSFKPGEITPGECHRIGLELAKEMWGDRYQIIVTTHLDKDHIHNHFCFNSVSFRDGKKYNYSKKERQRMIDISDRLCIEHGLSVIKNPHKAASRPVWFDEKQGKDTLYNIYRRDIVDAVNNSKSVNGFEKYLKRLGYQVDLNKKHWRIKMPGRDHYTRMDTLDERFTAESITDQIVHTRGRFAERPYAVVTYPPEMPQEYRQPGFIERMIQGTNLYKLYLYYCYQLGILPDKTSYRPTSPILKEDLRKADEISAQARYMERKGVSTMEDLLADRQEISSELKDLSAARTKIYNKMRRAKPEDLPELRSKRDELSKKIEILRRDLKCNHKIEERSATIKDKLQTVLENERTHSLDDRNRSRASEDRNER